MRLIAIGIVAGVFSALLGVGGGLIAVPLLILFAHVPERAATATSLSETTLRRFFATLLFAVAIQLIWRAARTRPRYPDSS